MSTSRTLGGVSHSIPALGESGWGANLSTYLIAIADSCLATDGGTRTLTAELSLGTNYGLKSLYLKSTGSNVGSTGVIRLANAESVVWRNAGNSADLALKVNASNVLEFNGTAIPSLALGTANQVLGVNNGATANEYKTISGTSNQVTVTHGANSITLSTPQSIGTSSSPSFAGLTLNGLTANRVLTTNGVSLVQPSAVTTTELGYLSGVTSPTGSGALVLATSPTLVTPVLGAATGTSLQLSGLTASRALTTDGSKNLASSAVTATELGYLSGVTAPTGSGALVLATAPTLVTPVLGVATATSINKVTLTAPATGSTLTIADGKTLTASNSLTLTGTDSSSVAFGSGGTVAYTSNKLSAFASTSSSELAGVLSDETGSASGGLLVFNKSPSFQTSIQLDARGEVRFADSDSSNYVGFKAPATVGTNKIWTLPDADGSGNQALSTDGSGNLIWQTVASASVATADANGLVKTFVPSTKASITAVTTAADFTIADNDGLDTIVVTHASSRIVKLPTAVDNAGRKIKIKKANSSSYTVTVQSDGSDSATIDGAATNVLHAQNSYIELVCDAANWYVTDVWDTVEVKTSGGVSLGVSTTSYNLFTTFSVTPGTWQIHMYVRSINSAATQPAILTCISANSAAFTGTSTDAGDSIQFLGGNSTADVSAYLSRIVTVTADTNYYPVVRADFSSGTHSAQGSLRAVRIG